MSAFDAFVALHTPGRPLILFNAWDAGSAAVIAKAGAQAIATGSWSVAAANGFGDGEELPMAVALANARAIVAAVDVPVTIDFEGGYSAEPATLGGNFAQLAATGAIGANFEDRVVGGEGRYGIEEQAARISAARGAVGEAFFLNARTDIFLQAAPDTHDAAMVDEAIARAAAYADAGASGFFAPGLLTLDLLARLCAKSPLPVNAITWPGAPSNAELVAAGVARISYGPGPYRLAMQAIEEAATALYKEGRG